MIVASAAGGDGVTDPHNRQPEQQVDGWPRAGGGSRVGAGDLVEVEGEPASVAAVFGLRAPLARRYVESLVGDGVLRGVLGPHEPARVWSRHVLNCAAVSELLAVGSRVVDVGSGAGLPGVVLALRRPDLRVDLVEPMQRRVDYLTHVVESLGLESQVRVVRGRSDDAGVVELVGGADWVTARAVAPLDRLVRWCLALVAPGGRLALIKGASASEELARHRAMLARQDVQNIQVMSCGIEYLDPPTQVITMQRVQGRKGRRRR